MVEWLLPPTAPLFSAHFAECCAAPTLLWPASQDVANAALPAFVTTLLFFAGQLMTFNTMPDYWAWYSYIGEWGTGLELSVPWVPARCFVCSTLAPPPRASADPRFLVRAATALQTSCVMRGAL